MEPRERGMSKFKINEVHYGTQMLYRVTETTSTGELRTVGKFHDKSKAEYYIKVRTQQTDPRHNQW